MANQKKQISISGITDKRFETKEIAKLRKALLMNVTGEILELGIGSGVNLPYYPGSVQHITGVDQAIKELNHSVPQVDHYYGRYQELPFDTDCFDTLVATFVLSNVLDLAPVLTEMKRVLRPRGRLIFMEPGRAQNQKDVILQNIVNPLWELIGGKVIVRDYFEELRMQKFIIANPVQTQVQVSSKSLFGNLYMGIAVNVK